ncbi:MAG: hypothetical protein JWO67_3286 [Streptosporangiaceae bacterium]|nr:hypothetical protein [Streptosporangiaceae bacterium]
MNGTAWRKSRRSSTNGGNCVEVARVTGSIATRDSKNPEGSRLTFTMEEFGAFLAEVKAGKLDG